MGSDNSPKSRQRANIARKQNIRASYERILIVTEGTKTEPLYLNEIRTKLRIGTANIQVQPGGLGTSPIQVVKYAQQLFEVGDSFKRIPKRAFEKVCAVFDRDDHFSYFDALELAASLDKKMRNDAGQLVEFRAIASVPSFELWLLLHYEDIQHPLHRDEVMRRLKTHIPAYEKGVGGSYAITNQHIETATARAYLLAERSNAFIDTEPYTDIAHLVALLNTLKA